MAEGWSDDDIQTLVENIDVLKEEYQELATNSWESQKLTPDELSEREERLEGMLISIDGMMAIIQEYMPTAKDLEECIKTQKNLQSEISRLKAAAKKVVPASTSAAAAGTVAPAQRVRSLSTKTGRRPPPRRVKCGDRDSTTCVVEGETNPCHWHQDQCMTGSEYNKIQGIKRTRATSTGASVKLGSKRDLTVRVKEATLGLGQSLPVLNDALKRVYDKTLSRLTIVELSEVLQDLLKGSLPTV